MVLIAISSPLVLLVFLFLNGFKDWDGIVFIWVFINALLSPMGGPEAAVLGCLAFGSYTLFMVFRVTRN